MHGADRRRGWCCRRRGVGRCGGDRRWGWGVHRCLGCCRRYVHGLGSRWYLLVCSRVFVLGNQRHHRSFTCRGARCCGACRLRCRRRRCCGPHSGCRGHYRCVGLRLWWILAQRTDPHEPDDHSARDPRPLPPLPLGPRGSVRSVRPSDRSKHACRIGHISRPGLRSPLLAIPVAFKAGVVGVRVHPAGGFMGWVRSAVSGRMGFA